MFITTRSRERVVVNESCRTCGLVMSHTLETVTSHVCMSCDMYECVMSHM